MITNFFRTGYALLVMSSVSGCGSDDPDPTPPDTLNFARVTREVINETNCGGPLCHTAGAAGFRLAANDQLYSQLVGQPATGAECANSGLTRIVVSDSANSLLYQKLNHTQPCGDPMPLVKLSDDKVELVRLWIDEGAVK